MWFWYYSVFWLVWFYLYTLIIGLGELFKKGTVKITRKESLKVSYLKNDGRCYGSSSIKLRSFKEKCYNKVKEG